MVKLMYEMTMLSKSQKLYSKYTKKLDNVRNSIKDFSKVSPAKILKLRNYNLVRFASFIFEMELLNDLESQDKSLTAAFLYEQMDTYSLNEVFKQEKECLYLENKSALKPDMSFLHRMIIETLKVGVDLDVFGDLLKDFVSNNDQLRSLKYEVLKVFYAEMQGNLANFDKEQFESMNYNINALFSSLVEKEPKKKDVLQPLFSHNDDKQR